MAATSKGTPTINLASTKSLLNYLIIALISSASSYVAITLAMPKQVIVVQHDVYKNVGPAEKQPEKPGETYPLGEFVINLADHRHYLKTTLQAVLVAADQSKKGSNTEKSGGDPFTEIKSQMAPYEGMFRDAVIMTLSHQNAAQLLSPTGMDLAKEQLKVALNRLNCPRKVVAIYYTDFVVQ
jgi:flagellar basal body-associated protein FliL